MIGTHLVPLRIQALKLVPVTVRLRVEVAERREFDVHAIFIVGQGQFPGRIDALAEERRGSAALRRVWEPEVGENHRWHEGIVRQLFRIK